MKFQILKFLILLIFIISKINFAQGYICAIGGGSEDYNDWSDLPYGKIVEKSDSGKIVILGVSDATNWLPDYFKSLGAKSAVNLKISSKSIAENDQIYNEIISANAVFLRGGDQYNYIRYWKGTRTEEAIKSVFQNGGVVAGTSAGAAVLGEFDFSAKYGSAYPKETLMDPFYSKIDFENNFLNLVPNVIFDTHFIERGRLGRLIPFAFNILHNYQKNILAVGIDDRTALFVSPDGIAEVFGSAAVTIFKFDNETNIYRNESNFAIDNIDAHQLLHGGKFDLNSLNDFNFTEGGVNFKPATIQIPEAEIWLSGTSDLQINLQNSIDEILISTGQNKTLLIYNPVNPEALKLKDSLTSKNIEISVLEVSSQTINSNESKIKINEAESIIIYANSPEELILLTDTTILIHENLKVKFNQADFQILLIGNSAKVFLKNFISNLDSDELASYRGRMNFKSGSGFIQGLEFQPMLYEDDAFYENRTSALFYGLMRGRKEYGIFLDSEGIAKLENYAIQNYTSSPLIIIDAGKTEIADSSKYKSAVNYGERQIAGFDKFKIHVTNFPNVFSFNESKFNNIVNVEEQVLNNEIDFNLEQNYPNPFNPSTAISYQLSTISKVELKVFDILGKEVSTLVNEIQSAGSYRINFDGSKLTSGIYFCRIKNDNQFKTIKMVLLK